MEKSDEHTTQSDQEDKTKVHHESIQRGSRNLVYCCLLQKKQVFDNSTKIRHHGLEIVEEKCRSSTKNQGNQSFQIRAP